MTKDDLLLSWFTDHEGGYQKNFLVPFLWVSQTYSRGRQAKMLQLLVAFFLQITCKELMVFLVVLVNFLHFYHLYQKNPNLKYFNFFHPQLIYFSINFRFHHLNLIINLNFFNYLSIPICWFPLALLNILIYLFLQNAWKLTFVFCLIISIRQLSNEQLLSLSILLEIQLVNVLWLYSQKEHKHS